MKFSKQFNLPPQAALDFVDIDNKEDLPLFFDPYVFANEEDPFGRDCSALISSFFETVLACVRKDRRAQGHDLLAHLQEPNEICLGWSSGKPRGRGVGRLQADQLYRRLAGSEAARSGLMSDLQDCELFVEGIGPDKISDITANIIRGKLIEYTQQQCALHGVSSLATVPIGPVWDAHNLRWNTPYVELPLISGSPVILVPKKTVRWTGDLSHQHQKFYRHFVLNYLKEEHLRANSALVHVLKKSRRVYKTELQEHYPLSKDFLFRFSRDNPAVLAKYREAYKRTKMVETSELDENFDEAIFIDALKSRLSDIPPGTKHADEYHEFMVGVLEYIFYPNLTYPKKEDPIHEGRKRIDITYVNAAKDGFFYRMHSHHNVTSLWVLVECKNYAGDPANPELDQLANRFGPNRGRFGILVCRKLDKLNLFLKRCRDTAIDGHGFIVPVCDTDIIQILDWIGTNERSQIDRFLEQRFGMLK